MQSVKQFNLRVRVDGSMDIHRTGIPCSSTSTEFFRLNANFEPIANEFEEIKNWKGCVSGEDYHDRAEYYVKVAKAIAE